MKKIIWLFSIMSMISLTGCGSMYPSTMTGEIVPEQDRRFEKVIDVPNRTKDALYIKVNAWFVETFNSAESVIEFQDKESGKIMGKYVFSFSEMRGLVSYANYVKSTLSIDVRDNRIRMVITDPYYKVINTTGSGGYVGEYAPLMKQDGIIKAWEEWNKLANSLSNYLNDDSDEW